MLAIAIGHRIARTGRLAPDGRPTAAVTDLAGTDGVADPAAALALLPAADEDEDVVLGLPASAGREAEARLRRAAQDAGLRVSRVIPEPVAVALHYGAIDEGVHRTVLVVDQAAAAADLTVLAITPDLTVRTVATRTGQLAGDHALPAIARELAKTSPDAVLLSGDLYTAQARRTEIEGLPEARGLTVRCTTPELAVVHGLLLLADFGLLRTATGPAPTGSHFPPPLEDPEPPLWRPIPEDPEPQGAPPPRPRTHEEPPPAAPAPAPAPEPAPEPEPPPTPEPEPGPEEKPPPRQPPPPPATPPSTTPQTLRSIPVAQLQTIRRDDHLLVLWAWPDSALTARVRWRCEDAAAVGIGPGEGDIRCQRRVYEHDGGLDLLVGRGAVTITVEALVPGPGVVTEGAASRRIPAEPPIVEYEPSLRRRLTGGRVATVTFTARTGCDLPALRIVHGLGRYRPTSPAEGTVLHEVPAQRLSAGTPLTVEFPLPGTRGPSWLVCFPAGGPDAARESGIDIRPTALYRLRVT